MQGGILTLPSSQFHFIISSRVKVNPKYYRPTEVEQLLGDPTKAKEKLGWKPKVSFQDLVKDMMESDIELMKKNPLA